VSFDNEASGAQTFRELTDTPSSFAGHAGKVAAVNVGETALEFVAVAGTGTVTSVGLSLPGIFSVTNSPVTTAGTLTGSLTNQNANLVFSGPSSGSPAAPTFRALVLNDLPSIAESTLLGNPTGSVLQPQAMGIGDGLGLNGTNLIVSFGTGSSNACVGNDSRLSDARTPTSHTHGSITNAGAIGSTANLPIITTTSGVLTTGSFGSSANTFCEGNDSRLSNARTPTLHASTHQHGGSDEVATATAAANAIPKAGAGGTLAADWIPDLSGTYQPLTIGVGSSLGTSGTVDLNLSALVGTYQTISLTGNITFTTSNRASGRGVTIRMSATGTPRTINYPAGWKFFGNGFPATLDESELLVTLFCFGSGDSDIVAAVAEAV
jgi:hypothetical protein